MAQNFQKMAISSLQCHLIDNCISKNPAYLHNIKKHSYEYFFKKSSTQNGPHLVKIWPKNASFCISVTVKYVRTGRVFGETTIYFMALLWENDHFLKFLGYFWPFLAILSSI